MPVTEPSAWVLCSHKMPPKDKQVLIRLRESAGGDVCDVACYIGRQSDGEDRWILADIRLDTKQITEWAHIFPDPPKDQLKAAERIGALAERNAIIAWLRERNVYQANVRLIKSLAATLERGEHIDPASLCRQTDQERA